MAIEIGQIVQGKVTSITSFGAFVALDASKSGMIHISEVSNSFVKDINMFLKVGQDVSCRVCGLDEKGRIALSMKQVEPKAQEKPIEEKKEQKYTQPPEIIKAEKVDKGDSFEDMMSRFMKTSNDKLSDLRKTMDSKLSSPGFSRKNNKKY